jgi:TonB family protein
MVLAHYSYHPIRSSQSERTAKQFAILIAVAAHLFFFVWLLQRHPSVPEAHDSSMLLVDIKTVQNPPASNPHRSYAQKFAAPEPTVRNRIKASAASLADSARVADAARPLVDEGQLAPTHGGSGLSTSAPTDASQSNAIGVRDGGSGGGTGVAAHPHFRVPKVLRRWIGEYPRSAFLNNEQGATDVFVTIDAEGHLLQAHIAKSSGSATLDAATLDAIQHYIFCAGERDGVPEAMDAYISLDWSITEPIIHHFSAGENSQRNFVAPEMHANVPKNLSTTKVRTRFGSFLGIQKEDKQDADNNDQ